MQGLQAPELPAGLWNLRRRPGRQPEARPFLLPRCANTGLRVGPLGREAWDTPSMCGYLAGEPTPWENQSWITMKTNGRCGEIPCYCKHSSPRGMGPCVPSNFQAWRSPSSVCGAGNVVAVFMSEEAFGVTWPHCPLSMELWYKGTVKAGWCWKHSRCFKVAYGTWLKITLISGSGT